VAEHVALLVGLGLVPAVAAVAGVDEEDVIFLDINPLLDIPGRVDAVVGGDVGEVDDNARAVEPIEGDRPGPVAGD
jgi:hypothetical protein